MYFLLQCGNWETSSTAAAAGGDCRNYDYDLVVLVTSTVTLTHCHPAVDQPQVTCFGVQWSDCEIDTIGPIHGLAHTGSIVCFAYIVP